VLLASSSIALLDRAASITLLCVCRCRVPSDAPPSQFDFTMQEDPNSAFERIRQKKRDVLIEIYKYLEAVPPQSPLPLKLLQQLLVMIQATFPQ
jgi:hypothetical protein